MLRYTCLIFFAISLLAQATPSTSAKNRHVIVVTIDGMAAYLFDDPKSPVPNLRKLAAQGVVAEGMKVSNPSVTWPNHTTLVTGVSPLKHSVLYNGKMFPDKRGELQRNPELDKTDLVAVPTVYDFLHPKGFRTAAVNWPCTRNAKTLDDDFPDAPDAIHFSTPKLIKDLQDEKILDDSSEKVFLDKSTTKRDDLWTDVACYILRTRQPNYLLFHLLIVDGTQHRYGPQSPEGYEALASADKNIGKLLDTLDKTGLRANTSIFIVADHGFEKVKKQIVSNVILRKAGLLETADKKARVQIISEGGTALVYFLSAKTRREDRKKVMELFKDHEGIEQVIEPKDFAQYSYPSPEKNSQMGELVLCAKPLYGFSSISAGNETIIPTREGGSGSHGYLATNPKMNAVFIAAGRDIQKGKRIDVIDNLDVAPTAAYLLGEKFPCDGKLLEQILIREK